MHNLDHSPIQTPNIAVVILAAGLSSRMGDVNKLLMQVNEKSLLQHTVDAAVEAGVANIVVVLGHDADNIKQKMADHPVRFVENHRYIDGQSSSVLCGLGALSGKQQGVLICLADQPLIRAAHLQQIIDTFEQLDEQQIVLPVYKGIRANPVLISEAVRQSVLADELERGCRYYIDQHPDLVYRLAVDDRAFSTDLDTPADVQAFIA